ncbi:CHAD domain-containing protein [Streptomyces sp. HNM0574]|nr:CHAD domain-containing protein [Streptomyces sp. HNM0574]NLU68028.1 CHAD domain-containing protein [Streptomyces sp. HNM0574]
MATARTGTGSPVGGVVAADGVRPDRPVPLLETVATGEVLGGYLGAQAAALLRALRLHGETVGSAESAGEAAEAVRRLRRAARRVSGTLYTYRPLLDDRWADQLRAELGWLAGTLAREYGYASRLDRLLGSLHRLAGDGSPVLPAGAARAGALLERQLTLARTRAHSAALQAVRSSRFHAVVDAVALLASDSPVLDGAAVRPAARILVPQADSAWKRATESVGALPLSRAEAPYNAEGLERSLASEAQQDAAWHQARTLLRLHRYAEEVLRHGLLAGAEDTEPEGPAEDGADGAPFRLEPGPAGDALNRHREAAEAASAAAAAARTPRIAPATAYALGVLHAGQRHEVEAARFDFGRAWNPDRAEQSP